jgi:hypothetical protein
MEEKINNLEFLNEDDKKILITAYHNNMDYKILQMMSIFSKLGSFKKMDDYEYFETFDNEEIFYIKNCDDIFVDKDKKFILPNRYFFSCGIDLFIRHVELILNRLKHININSENTTYIGSNIIYVEKWFETYGHFKDEMYIMADFCEKISANTEAQITCFTSYKYSVPHINYGKENYDILCNFLFDKFVNPYKFDENIIKMKNV